MEKTMFIFSLIFACSEYEINAIKSTPEGVDDVVKIDDEPAVDTDDTDIEVDTDVPADTDEQVDEDELVSSDECGFLVNQPFNYSDVETESLAIFSNIGDTAFEIRQGETARYQFAVTALSCGDIDLNIVMFQVDDDSACNSYDCWIGDMALSHLPMYLSNLTDAVTYEPYDLSQQIHNLIYAWVDGLYDRPINGVNGNMTTVHVTAGTTKILEFDFTATQNIPVGNTIRIFLTGDVWWTDVTTNNTVWDTQGAGTDLAVTYTIIE